MIRLIRSDGMEILLNADQIHSLTESPGGGTQIRLLDGEEVAVKNHPGDITTKTQAWIQGRRNEGAAAAKEPPEPDPAP